VQRHLAHPAPSRRELLGTAGVLLGAAVLLNGSTPYPAQAASVPAHAGHAVTTATPARTRPVPQVHARKKWDAVKPTRKARVRKKAPEYIVVHHTATPNSSDDSRKQAFRLSRSIQKYHMTNNGWPDVGQQLTISRGGHVMEGRKGSLKAIRNGRHLVGTQARGYNPVSLGIENEGNYDKDDPPDALYDSLIETCAWLCTAYDLDTSAIVGHRDLVATACPGDHLYDQLPQLRDDVDALLALPEA
jgi:hypothetical protein